MPYSVTKPYADPQMQRTLLWVAEMMPAAESTAAKLGISPEAIVAQAALESAWGRAAIGHNLFGIKADGSWKGAVLTRNTSEQRADGSVYYVVAAFRDYPSWEASIEDHFAFLDRNSRYRDAGVFNAGSDRAYFQALQRAGYATDVAYADKLTAMLSSVKVFTARLEQSDVAPALAGIKPAPRLLMVGSRGGDVAALQAALAQQGWDIEADGDYGAVTEAVVRAFQQSHPPLTVDGIAGRQTQAAAGV